MRETLCLAVPAGARLRAGTADGLLGRTLVLAVVTTCALSLDTTVVLLTPVVLAAPAPAPAPAPAAAPAPGAGLAPADRRERVAPTTVSWPAAVVGATFAGFVVATGAGIDPAWVALGGAAVAWAPAVARDRRALGPLARAADPAFLLFVLGLAVVVRAAGDAGLQDALASLLPGGSRSGRWGSSAWSRP